MTCEHGAEINLASAKAEPTALRDGDGLIVPLVADYSGAMINTAIRCASRAIASSVISMPGLEGKKTGDVTGPVTFGEIAYQLLNQTLVYLNIIDIRRPATGSSPANGIRRGSSTTRQGSEIVLA